MAAAASTRDTAYSQQHAQAWWRTQRWLSINAVECALLPSGTVSIKSCKRSRNVEESKRREMCSAWQDIFVLWRSTIYRLPIRAAEQRHSTGDLA